MKPQRILDPEDDSVDEITLRPQSLQEFVGQKEILENLRIFIQAARKRKQSLDHVLLSGPPGVGKTTLANIVAREMGTDIIVTSSRVLLKGADLARLLTTLKDKEVLFIDEIHGLHRGLEELLYPSMEDFKLDIIVGEGITAQTVQVPLKPFTLVGATTRSGLISEPLKNRFGIQLRLDYYNEDDIAQIVLRSSDILKTKINKESAIEIAKRSRKIPRIANHLLKRIRDFAEVQSVKGNIDLDICKLAFERLGIDELGLEHTDRQILKLMIERYKGGPVGIKSISILIGEEERTIEDNYESFMVRIGLINRTPSGRVVSEMAYKHLNLNYHNEKDNTIF